MAAAQKTDKPGLSYLHQWVLTTADPNGDAISIPGAPDRVLQTFGSFGAGTLRLQGSLDGGNTWFNLHDPSVTVIGLTSDGGTAVLENPLMIRPLLENSTGASVAVYLFSRSNP